MKNIFKTLFLSVFLVTSCGSDDDGSPSGGGGGTDIFANTNASYTLDFESTFSEDMYPVDYPDNPTFGTVLVITHGPEISVFEMGQLATEGLQAYAEDGDVDGLASFLNQEAGMENEGSFSITTIPAIGPVASASIDVTITPTRSRITFLAKLNPSPDWFVGVSSFDVIDGNELIDEATFVLRPIDAGTAAGNTYEAMDMPESVNISTYVGLPFADGPFTAGEIGNLNISRDD